MPVRSDICSVGLNKCIVLDSRRNYRGYFACGAGEVSQIPFYEIKIYCSFLQLTSIFAY